MNGRDVEEWEAVIEGRRDVAIARLRRGRV